MTEESKTEPPKVTASKTSNWWQTFPGVLTAIAGIITAIAGLVAALHQAGIFPMQTPTSPQSSVPAKDAPSDPIESSPPIVSPPPTASQSERNPQTLVLAGGMEAKLQSSAYGNAVYKVLSAQLEPFNAENRSLKLTIRFTNNDRYGMNFWNQSFRLLVDGVPRAPSNDLNELVEAQSAKEGEVIFTVPISTSKATLQIGDPGKETTQIPFDFSTAKPLQP